MVIQSAYGAESVSAMRIIIVSLRRDLGTGSVGTIVEHLAHHLASKGHEVRLVIRKWHPHEPDFETVRGIDVYRFYAPSRDSVFFFLYPFFAAINVYRLLVRLVDQTDLINYHSTIPAILSETLRLGDHVPRVLSLHSPAHREWMYDTKGLGVGSLKTFGISIMRFVEKHVLSRMDKIVTLSEYMRGEAENLLGEENPTKFTKIPGAVDTATFTDDFDKTRIRAEIDLPQTAFVFLTVRRLVPRMGLENLVTAFELVSQRCPNSLLLIAGTGWLRDKLENMIAERSLQDSIFLLGYIPDDLLVKVYQASDVFVLPTESLEGFGVVILEAFATNTPVIGVDVGAIREVIEQFNSKLLIPSSHPSDIAKKMITAILDPGSISLYQDYASIVRKEFGWERQMAKYEQTFNQLLCRQQVT